MTWNKAYSIFPVPTFLRHEVIPTKPLDHEIGQELLRASKRGWRFLVHDIDRDNDDARRDHKYGMEHVRRVGDRYTWTMRLDTTGVTRNETPDSVIEYSAFRVTGGRDDGRQKRGNQRCFGTVYGDHSYFIDARLLSSPSLRYNYTYGGSHEMLPYVHAMGFEWDDIREVLDRNTLDQLWKLDKLTRDKFLENQILSDTYNEGMCGPLRFNRTWFDKPCWIKRPDGWDFYDDMIPDLWAKAERFKERLLKARNIENIREMDRKQGIGPDVWLLRPREAEHPEL
jgi:hypothetical protein